MATRTDKKISDDEVRRFIEDCCQLCGSQRCDPYDDKWREGGQRWKEFIKNKSIMIVVSDGRTKVYSADTSQKVYIIDQRRGKGEPPTLTKANIEYENVELLERAYDESGKDKIVTS